MKRKVAKAQKRIAELDVLIKKLYETYAMGKLEEKRFEMLSAEYEKEQDELEQTLASDQASLDQFNEDTDRADKFLALAKKYTDFSELTAPMINEFVEKIVVHAPDRSTGERIQEIEIYLKFIGKFDVPMPEPTPEELAAEEKRRQKRIRDHEKYLRQKERKKKIAEGQIVPGEPYAAGVPVLRGDLPLHPPQRQVLYARLPSAVLPPAKTGASAAGCSIRAGTCGNQQNRITPNTAACPTRAGRFFYAQIWRYYFDIF